MEEEKKFTVYLHRCPNGKCYVGMTSQTTSQRWRNGSGYKNNKDFYPDIEKYGWDNVEHIILEEGLSREDACESEKYNIKKYNCIYPNGYNLSVGGDLTSLGVKRTEEYKINLSKKAKERNKDENYRKNASIKMKEWHKTHENPNIGRPQSERNKLSKARKINIYTKDGKFIETMFGMNTIVEKYNMKKPEIIRACKTKNAILLKQYTCRYYDEFPNENNIERQISGGEKLQIWLEEHPEVREQQVKNMLQKRKESPIVWTDDRRKKQSNLLVEMRNSGKMNRGNLHTKRVVCEGIVFDMIKDLYSYYDIKNLSSYLTGRDKMPKLWESRGLRYYNPDTDKDLPIYVDKNLEV